MKSYRLTALLLIFLFGCSISMSAVDYCATSAFGYGAGATGGGSATPTLVSSVSQLQSALNKGKNKVIIITQSLTFTSMLSVQDGSNVTLLGLPGVTLTSLQQDKTSSGILYVKRFNNLIIRNLTFVGPGAYDCDGNDLLCLQDVTNSWVDHCDFQDGCDGNFDNKNGTDNVTVSWCRFRYLKAPRSGGSGGTDDHRFTNLLGSSSSDKPSDGTYNMTWAYCWWDDGCKERMLRCRNASLHFLNCYWNSSVANYYIGPENADCYIEGCTFEGAPKTAKIFYQNYGGENGSKFINCTATKGLPGNVSDRTVVTPSYSYTALTAAEAKTAVTNATCGAGATLTVTTAGAVSSTCDGGAPLPTVWTVTWDATTNGGSCGTATSSVTNGAAIGTLPEATKTSFNFDGWYTAPSGGTKISASTTVTENKTYYAQFTSAPVTTYYTVIWDANGGTCGTSSSSIESGQQIGTLPVASKAGDYSFDGWYTAVNGGTKISTTTTVTANVTYYAHYTATGGGGGGSCASTLTHYGTQYRTSAPRRGFAYVGSTSGTKFIIESDNSNTKNVDNDSSAIRLDYGNKYLKVLGPGATTDIADSLFTGVTQISFKWKLYNSGTTTRTTTVDVYVGGTKVGNAIELTGLNSDGFQTHTISSIASLSGAVTIKNTGTGNSNKNLHFDDISITYNCSSPSPTTYTLSYDENGGSGTMAATEQTGASVTVAANGFTAPTGYSFQKWNTDMNGGGTDHAASDVITLTEDMTLYAIWQPNTYAVTLNAEGGIGGSASVTATFDAALPNITIPTRDGYVFKGYYTGTDGTGTQYYDTNGSSTNDWTIAANTELHAYWETGSTPIVSGCDLHFWFVKEADATTNSKTNDGTFFSGMVANSSSLSGSITIDGTSYSVTGRSGDAASFGSFTIPTGHAGTFYALAVSSGSGDRQINLNNGSEVYELPVAGGSSSYKRIESEELPAGTYTIERDGTSNVRLGIVVVKVCSTAPCSNPDDPTGFDVGSVTASEATFTITDPANTNNYEIYYSTDATAPTSSTSATVTTATVTKTISGLTANTTYYAWVRAVCDAEHKSAWVALTGASFTTTKISPTKYNVGASAEGECVGGMTAKITLSGSQAGVYYRLKNNGTNDGDAKAGTGNALEWTSKGSGVYTIWAEENATYSGLKMTGTATVVVYDVTAITTQPTTTISAETDESYTLGSNMVAAGHELTYRWYTCSSTGTDTIFISGATSATYTTSESVANTYFYRVRVAGTCGDPVLSDVIAVTVTSLLPPSADPTITDQPVGASYCAEESISALSVTATGSGTLSYQWKKDGVNIPSANSNTYTPVESGTYACVVTNMENGKAPALLSSANAVVTIKAAVVSPTLSQTDNTVNIATVTDGATIYYTTDGSDPTTSSSSGTSVSIVADCTVKAYAVKDGCASSITSFVATYDPMAGAPCVTLVSYTLTSSGTTTQTIAADENNLVGGSADYSVSSTSTNGGYKLNNDQYFGITLASGQFKAGDKVTVTITKASDQGDGGLHLCTSKTGTAVLSIAAGDVVVGDNVFTLSADCDAIYVARNGYCAQNPYVKSISVCRKLIEYTVTFDKNDAAATGTMAPQTFYSTIASKINANTFALAGNSFAGWATSPSGSKVYDDEESITIASDVTLYALWTLGVYPITLNTNGGTINSGNVTSYTYGVGATLPTDITRTGYIFGGWFDNAGCTGSAVTIISTTDEGAKEFFAKWTARTTNLTLDGNGATNSYTTAVTATYDEAMPAIAVLPTRDGYFFGGYYDGAGGTGKKYYTETGDSECNWDKEDATFTLYANWIYDDGCRAWEGTPTSWSDSKITVSTLQLESSKTSNTTIGSNAVWSGHNETVITINSTDVYVQGHFTDGLDLGTVTISAANNQSAGSNYKYAILFCANSSFSYGVTSQLGSAPSASDSQDDTKLIHSFTAPFGAKYFRLYRKVNAAVGEVSNVGDGQTIRFYRIEACPAPTYTITYKANGGTGADVIENKVRVVGSMPVSFTPPSGKAFDHWNTADDNSGVDYNPGDEISGNLTLYAQWKDYYETALTLVADGANNAYTTSATAVYEEDMPALAVLPTKDGFEFAGYYDGVGGTGKMYYRPNGNSACVWDKTAATATLYAKWTYPSYTYILGYCYVKNGLWTQGSNGSYGAWRYIEEDGVPNLLETEDITCDTELSNAGMYFNTKDLTKLHTESYWGTSSTNSRAIIGFKIASGTTVEFDLKSLQANRITYYILPTSNSSYSIELTVNGVTETKAIPANSQYVWQYFEYDDGNYTGTFSIKSNSQDTRCVIVVNVPPVGIAYDANGGIGTMSPQLTLKGAATVLNANEFSKPGYVFGGWTEDAGGAGTVILDEATITPTTDITLYAKWLTPCEVAPTLQPVAETFSIKNDVAVDMSLVHLKCDYDTTTVKYALRSASETITGCIFKYYDSKIHIVGTPTGYSSEVTKNITFTIENNCMPQSTFEVTVTIKIHPSSWKPKIAFIVTGTEKGDFNAYSSSDASSCSGLLTYLASDYDITCVNGYATKDPTEIAMYYSQYDLLIVTDYLETGKGYTNAIGTLIDKKPILSFEAYVAGKNGSNWHIGSNPQDPSPKVKDMKVLCSGHSVFSGGVLESDGETVHVLDALSSNDKAKGLQGFVINEAPDFLFLATIRDANHNRDLIVCCERQLVFPARLMIYGINYFEMGNLSANGKLAMKQMVDYLLLTDESRVADCALVFDNHAGDHKWSNPANWAPTRTIVPTAYQPTRIIAPCEVDIEDAHASSVKINIGKDKFDNTLNGKITVLPQGGLTVAGFINKVKDTRYVNLLETDVNDVIIQADASHNGALVYGNKTTDVSATVQYYSMATGANTSSTVWQYIGIPVQARQTAIEMYYEAWMCRWAEESGLGGLWQWVETGDILIPFEGYCITQDAAKTYTLQGKLNAPVSQVLKLNVRDADGYAFAANSWTAPIKVKEMADDDFNNVEGVIYIYHTGSYENFLDNGTPVDATSAAATLPGQYAAVPIHAAKYVAFADSVIPPMQGFFVKTTSAGARLELVYNRVVYDAKYFKTTASPMRIPQRIDEAGEPDVMQIGVYGAHGGDQVYLLSQLAFTEQYENGWDGRKMKGDTMVVPSLAVVKESGEMAVAAIPTVEGRLLSFRAGQDSVYTFGFNYDGDTAWYLYDQIAKQATLIKTGNTYTFEARNTTAIPRFVITANPPEIPTDIETVGDKSNRPVKYLENNHVYIFYNGEVHDVTGKRVTPSQGKEGAQ